MNISFKKDMNKSYMVVEKVREFSPHHFMIKMLSENEIQGLLKTGYENINGQYNMLYDISSKQAFSKYFEKEKLSFEQIKAMLFSLKGVLRSLREHLLDVDNIILKQECIFTDPDGKSFSYCYFPYYNGDLILEIRELFAKMLSMVNYEDERAVRLVIEMQNGLQAENVTIEDLMEIYTRVVEEFRPKVQKIELPDPSLLLQEEQRNRFPAQERRKSSPQQEQKKRVAEDYLTDRQNTDWDFLDDETPFFEKVRCYLKGKKVMDVLEDINNREFLEKVRQCGRAEAVPEIFDPAEAELEPEKPAFEYISISEDGFQSTVAEPKPYRTHSMAAESKPYHTQNTMAEPKPYRKQRTLGADPFRTDYSDEFFEAGFDGTVLLGDKEETVRKLAGRNKQQGVRILLKEFPFTIGSSERGCDAQIDELTISRMHARFYKEKDHYYVEDLNSMNGTYLNEDRLESYKKTEIQEGDILRFAEEEFCFR